MISKGALAAMAGAGMTGAAGTGAYYMGAFDGLLSGNTDQSTGTIAKTFQSIRQEEKFECLNSILPELHQTIKNSLDSSSVPDGAKEITSENKVEDTFFEQNVTHKFNNCLDVNWDKKLGSDNKWHGNFRYLWSFNHKDQALVIFNSLETSSSSTDPTITGGIYFVKKGGPNGTSWVVDKYKK